MPEWRGRGLGQGAVRLAEQYATDRWGVTSVRLRVRQENAKAIACYHVLGYRTLAMSEKIVAEQTVAILEMEHDLRAEAL